MADYWIKLYLAILDDSKMAVLPDRLWRRTIELFLLAGLYHKDGLLPETNQLAWMLRMSTDDLALDLQQIATTGIIERVVNGWLVVNFAKRQAASTPAERMRQMRSKQHNEQYNGNVTDELRNVTQIQINRLTDTESDTEQKEKRALDPFEAMRQTVERLIGYPMTQRDIDPINKMIEKGVAEDDIKDALTWLDGKKKIMGAADIAPSAIVTHGKRVQTESKTEKYHLDIYNPGATK